MNDNEPGCALVVSFVVVVVLALWTVYIFGWDWRCAVVECVIVKP